MSYIDEMDRMLAQSPEQTLEDAWQHIVRRRQRAPGRYEIPDLMAMIVLDHVQRCFNPYPFLGEKRPS